MPISTTRAPFEHDDQIGHAHGGEAVRHEDGDPPVVRIGPVRAPSRAARGVALEQRVLGLGVERRRRLVEHQQQRSIAHEAAGQRELLPLAERHLDAAGPGRPELRVEPGVQALDDIGGAGAIDGRDDGGLIVQPGDVADADVWRARNSKRKKS